MRDHLRAGIAVHNAGEYHAAHDAWEDRWLSIKEGMDAPSTAAEAAARDERRRSAGETGDGTEGDTDDPPSLGVDGPTPEADERLLHGLIQFTAAVYKATDRQWAGARSLASGGRTYLAPLPATYRGVDVAGVRSYCSDLAADPETIERRPVPELTHEGEAVALSDLAFPAAAVAAETIAEEYGYDEDTVERAVEYARADLDAGEETSPFVTLVMDFARREDRGIVYDRLRQRVQRRRAREEDVDGLFEG